MKGFVGFLCKIDVIAEGRAHISENNQSPFYYAKLIVMKLAPYRVVFGARLQVAGPKIVALSQTTACTTQHSLYNFTNLLV